ncbi:MAG: DUF1287 domain-containing protein [Bacteroidia bacterium]
MPRLLICILFVFLMSFQGEDFFMKLSKAAIEHTNQKVKYDGRYVEIAYPNGDVPDSIGVCTDVIIRVYRKFGVDLQQLIHEDMLKHKAEYDKRRNTLKLNASIDHRRTPNMQTFFTREGAKLPVTSNDADYKPGDIVFWDVAYGHVGFVTHEKVPGTTRPYIVHNIGAGNKKEDFLYGAKLVDHYRWKPKAIK